MKAQDLAGQEKGTTNQSAVANLKLCKSLLSYQRTDSALSEKNVKKVTEGDRERELLVGNFKLSAHNYGGWKIEEAINYME